MLSMEFAVKRGVCYLLGEVQLSLEGSLFPYASLSGAEGICK